MTECTVQEYKEMLLKVGEFLEKNTYTGSQSLSESLILVMGVTDTALNIKGTLTK